ncbi:hypothetical protein FQA47_010958 [Oryzias melastigma]|uniref:Uncharacterized protein n=1 Tax=Oryzias melastigma TaxID=30732 RepID=A0A834C3Z5_ORYME|nr:hypothetical protein FQA47_010958 [Oryzias melastigma]
MLCLSKNNTDSSSVAPVRYPVVQISSKLHLMWQNKEQRKPQEEKTKAPKPTGCQQNAGEKQQETMDRITRAMAVTVGVNVCYASEKKTNYLTAGDERCSMCARYSTSAQSIQSRDGYET